MMEIMIEILACVIETFIIIDFITQYLGMKEQKYKGLKCGGAFFGALGLDLLITFHTMNENLALCMLILLCVGYGAIFLKGNILEKIFLPILTYLLITIINGAVMTIFNTVMGNEYADLLNMQLELRATLLGITKLALFLVTQFILHLKREKKYELKTAEWMIVILMFGITMIVSIILHDIMLKQKYQSTLFAIVMFSLICLTVFTYVIISAISKNNEKLKEMELMQMQLRQQEENIQAVQERYEEIATIRHDMKNYVASALSLLRDQKYDETEKYLQNFKDLKIGKYKSYVVTDNALINAVLNAKFSYAQEQNIGVKCVITAGLAGMRNYDTSILLSNILDNAIEACEQGKHMYEPKIDVLIRDVASYLHISIKNTISESVLENNKELRTTKKDKKLHGYGTKSCQRIVDAMDGDMEILEEDGWFVVDILLPKSGI